MDGVDPVQLLAERLRAVRVDQGLTQDDVADVAGMDAAELRRIESGRREPGVRVLFRLARALKTTPADLLQGIS